MSRKRKKQNGLHTALTVLILAMIAVILFLIVQCVTLPEQKNTPNPDSTTALTQPTETTAAPTETTLPEPEHVVATASISAQGDLLMHIQLFSDNPKYNSVNNLGGGTYNFDSIFEYMTDYTSAYDYAIANLETTFGGDNYPYQGNPAFNCPDELADAAADAGYDMLLTANNHCGDTNEPGLKRTLEVVREAGVATLGTRLTAEEERYSIVEINGIKIGMICYTYSSGMKDGKPRLNGGLPFQEPELVNYFSNTNLDAFYAEITEVYTDMMAAGAEASILYIHWGDEYYLEENFRQNQIAQKMCDLGFDVIAGGHPHVVQPMELLTSTTDPDHKTVCLYSMGNAVSNQRYGNISMISTPHTEDGVLFSVTFEKYSDGTVYLAETDILPTWVNMHYATGKREYNILPLDETRAGEWAELFDIEGETLSAAQRSYDRTMAILGEGLTECQEYLTQAKADREAYYYDLAFRKR
ncbi:MAG: CapA family protein [Oscillospiraceae bacterium]|nr:CapA family protein [Oscillospiraceae bacterium]